MATKLTNANGDSSKPFTSARKSTSVKANTSSKMSTDVQIGKTAAAKASKPKSNNVPKSSDTVSKDEAGVPKPVTGLALEDVFTKVRTDPRYIAKRISRKCVEQDGQVVETTIIAEYEIAEDSNAQLVQVPSAREKDETKIQKEVTSDSAAKPQNTTANSKEPSKSGDPAPGVEIVSQCCFRCSHCRCCETAASNLDERIKHRRGKPPSVCHHRHCCHKSTTDSTDDSSVSTRAPRARQFARNTQNNRGSSRHITYKRVGSSAETCVVM